MDTQHTDPQPPGRPHGAVGYLSYLLLLLLGLAGILGSLGAAPAAAQVFDLETSRILGRIVATSVVLASDDFASSGHYDTRGTGDNSFRIRQLAARHHFQEDGFEADGAWQPFIGIRGGQFRQGQDLDFGSLGSGEVDFEIWALTLEGGAGREFGNGWYGVLQGKTGYSRVENRLEYDDARSAEILGPLVDGVLFNFDAEVFYLEAGVSAGRRWELEDGSFFQLEAGAFAVRTDPVVTDDPIQDRTTETHFERLSASVEVPLDGQLFGRSLAFGARLRHTFLDRDLATPLGSNGFTDVRLTLLTLSPVLFRGQGSIVGVSLAYTTGESFEGWSVGLAFRH